MGLFGVNLRIVNLAQMCRIGRVEGDQGLRAAVFCRIRVTR